MHIFICEEISTFLYRYPNPSEFTYERRLFCPFEYALQPPPWYKPEHIAVNKPEVPSGVSELKLYDGPQCFIIPGNHGWCFLTILDYLEVGSKDKDNFGNFFISIMLCIRVLVRYLCSSVSSGSNYVKI